MNTSAAIHPLRRLLAFFLTLAMLLSAMPLAEISAAAGNGFELWLTWELDDTQYFTSEEDYENSGATHEDVADPDTFVSYSKTGEDAYVRLRVHYANPLISSGYSPRGITIKVTGLRGAIRNSNNAPEAIVAADELSSSSKKYTWSYSYNSVEDAYYFTNNNAIEENTVFEGTFEIAWKLNPRESVHDFDTTVSATLLASGYTVSSNELTYQQKRLKDKYELFLNATNPYRYEVPFEAVNARYGTQLDLENAIWVKYSVSGKDEYKARDLVNAEEFRLYFPNALAAYMATSTMWMIRISQSGSIPALLIMITGMMTMIPMNTPSTEIRISMQVCGVWIRITASTEKRASFPSWKSRTTSRWIGIPFQGLKVQIQRILTSLEAKCRLPLN